MFPSLSNKRSPQILLLIGTLAAVPALLVYGQQPKAPGLLHIGASQSLATGNSRAQEETAMASLRTYIKDQTGLNNEIQRDLNWRTMAKKMADGQVQIGVFEGYEFAWARELYHDLEPLAIAVNVYRYPVAYVVARKDQKVTDFASLQGQSFALPTNTFGSMRLFVERQCQAQGKSQKDFFAKVTTPANVEGAIDDVVDGVVTATVADRGGLEAYRKLKPGRFARLKEVIHSQPFSPTVVAYYNHNLDEVTLKRFLAGLLGASENETGKMLLNLFRLTRFEAVPNDFNQVLAATRKAYPPLKP
jgi:ABC-type phosphate/phosphonate transport system substrate-binding protein